MLWDPQLDVNVLIGLVNRVPECVSFAISHQADGLSYNEAAAAEFLAQGTSADLQTLEATFGALLIDDVSADEIDACAKRLQQAFAGDALRRVLRLGDARVAATAHLKDELLATADLQFFKRGRDVGLKVGYVGSGAAAARAKAYIPNSVSIPKP